VTLNSCTHLTNENLKRNLKVKGKTLKWHRCIQEIVAYIRWILLAKYISLIWNAANYMAALCAEFFITSQRMNYACNRAYGHFAVPPQINIRVCTHVKILDVHARSWQFSQHLNRTRLRDGNEGNLIHARSIFCMFKYSKLRFFSFWDHAFFKIHIIILSASFHLYHLLLRFSSLFSPPFPIKDACMYTEIDWVL